MKLRTFKSKKDKLYYFQLRSNRLGKIFLTNPTGFDSKINRNDLIISVLHSLSDKNLHTLKESKNKLSFLILKNKFGKTILNSKRFNKNNLSIILKELDENLIELKNEASQKPNSNLLGSNLGNHIHRANSNKKVVLKKENKPKAEKKYLKKGQYHSTDIYYDIFLSNNAKHYFSFINKAGKTVLLNANIKGFESLTEAESQIEEVLKFAAERKNFEIKTAKDGKLFFYLYNEKREKIAKSFFFRKEEEIIKSINEFVGTFPINQNQSSSASPILDTHNQKTNTMKEKEESRKRIEAEERRKAAERERLSLENKRKQETLANNKRKEKVLATSSTSQSETIDKSKKETTEPVTNTKTNDIYAEKDMFDGCFKWLGLIFILLLLALLFSYFKGCGVDGILDSKKDQTALSDTISVKDTDDINDSLNGDNTTGTSNDASSSQESDLTAGENASSNQSSSGTNKNEVLGSGASSSSASSSDASSSDASSSDASNNSVSNNSNTNSSGSGNQGTNNSTSNQNKNSINNSNNTVANCNCSDKAVVFEIPNTIAKSIKKLGSNPQFGNTHGLNSSDFLEELKHAAQSNSWDKKYLDYLYKAMGYTNGFADAKVSQVSQSNITPGVTGILGFGKYSGYGYSKLDLKGRDLETFRIEAANGCHINFMKTCGNLLFICE